MDMTKTIAPKSTQLNADDLIGSRSLTITITKVDSGPSLDQPVALHHNGGLPYLPCKSMRRVLVHCWGKDASVYVGRSLTLYRDEKVRFGGAEVGGIRISHLSDIDGPQTMSLTATRAQRIPFTVKPLVTVGTKPDETKVDLSSFDTAIEKVKKALTNEQLESAVAESRLLKGWPKDKAATMKATIEEQRLLINQQNERQPGEE